MAKAKRAQSLEKQFLTALLAGFALFLLAYFHMRLYAVPEGGIVVPKVTTQIGLEYSGSAFVNVRVTRKASIGIIRIDGDDNQQLAISLPTEWKRTHVFHASLNDITANDSGLGFTRWTIPAGGGVQFSTERVPDEFVFITPAKSVATVHLQTIDLQTMQTNFTNVLLQEESRAVLWE